MKVQLRDAMDTSSDSTVVVMLRDQILLIMVLHTSVRVDDVCTRGVLCMHVDEVCAIPCVVSLGVHVGGGDCKGGCDNACSSSEGSLGPDSL